MNELTKHETWALQMALADRRNGLRQKIVREVKLGYKDVAEAYRGKLADLESAAQKLGIEIPGGAQ